eukprot:scaffold34343_cov74-Phaeocystis_antarctica.AAC.5
MALKRSTGPSRVVPHCKRVLQRPVQRVSSAHKSGTTGDRRPAQLWGMWGSTQDASSGRSAPV